ncbi:MAG: hypothetical protein IPN92_06145 [Chromatiaceae bacterium]|nr:hypothetical protein [Chromatiaceae bacterium]
MNYSRIFLTFAFFAVGLLAILGSATEPVNVVEATTPFTLSEADVAAIKKGVSEKLLDPTSPLFGSMQARKANSNRIIVCGYVNAKNTFGGYTGDKPYVGELYQSGSGKKVKSEFSPIQLGGTRLENYDVREMCLSKGFNF